MEKMNEAMDNYGKEEFVGVTIAWNLAQGSFQESSFCDLKCNRDWTSSDLSMFKLISDKNLSS